ncbi:MAG: Lrp/AsnC family transcriptional regulator [Rhizobiaceae bacterium]|nr:Lrp/AsnC family transcriptional regulator [Rhizobiaceae bacterium]
MNVVFVQIRCKPGTAYKVADVLYEREICSSLYSTSGEWDLMAKIYPPKDTDVGKFLNDNLLDIEGVERTLTTLTFKAF